MPYVVRLGGARGLRRTLGRVSLIRHGVVYAIIPPFFVATTR